MSGKIKRRVAVTGMGIITSIGESLPVFRKNLFEGTCGIGPISIFDTDGFSCHSAGEVTVDITGNLSPREIKRVSRCDLLGLIAADEALSGLGRNFENYDKDRIGIILGGGAGGMLSWEHYQRAQWTGQSPAYPTLLLPAATCTLSDLIAARYGLTGYRSTICTACSSSATSIGYGYDLIRAGIQDVILAGGSESLSELTFTGFHSLKLMDPYYCRPFDKNRRGLSLGEGAAVFVLESYDRAVRRDAVIHAEVLGYAINSDAVHITAPDSGGMSRVMTQALKNVEIGPETIDYINAHGTATPMNDLMETAAIRMVFTADRGNMPPVSSTKSQVGHCLGASGAVEAAATILALQEQMIPPTIHLDDPDPECGLDHVPNISRKKNVRIAMSNSFAFGGNNTSLLLGRGA
ncbi:MAG TPA: beta-ketoacyl-[acyl-carrier-protein] synthase family protein [Deltaproteobacteria bacterium]|nr:beta-ketoacyl-[acyl-carrier-protein] synthase family protein [Deltaproteobacteria bacterium]HEU20592.1 beta-ketoacyl-[acyl-carrier-protein] synthase family protein [Deltaproteobacteria bacterium]